jgi:hypothetical protein
VTALATSAHAWPDGRRRDFLSCTAPVGVILAVGGLSEPQPGMLTGEVA